MGRVGVGRVKGKNIYIYNNNKGKQPFYVRKHEKKRLLEQSINLKYCLALFEKSAQSTYMYYTSPIGDTCAGLRDQTLPGLGPTAI